MKQKLLLICVCLFAAVSGVKAWTSVDPENGGIYYLYNVGYEQFWYGTNTNIGGNQTRYFGITDDYTKMIPVKVSVNNGTYTFTYYVGNNEYQMRHQTDGGESYYEGGSADFTMEGSKDDGFHIKYSYTKSVISHTRRLRAEGSNSTCDFPENQTGNSTKWKFVLTTDVCASVAEENYVSGWEKVTSVSALKTTPENYFFAIFSANVPGLILDATTSNSETTKPYYKTAANPLSSAAYLFEMETCGSGLALKSCSIDKYFANSSSAPWHYEANKSSVDDDCEISVTLSDGVYSIQAKHAEGVNNYLGLWWPENGYKTGQKLAGNKSIAEKGLFLIYRIAKENLSLTERIVNPDMETSGGGGEYWQEGVNGWGNCSNATNYRQLAFTEGQNPNGAFTGTNAFENWTPSGLTGQMSQTISNLPNGVYKLQLAALVRSVNGQFIYGKSNGKVYKTDLSGDGEKAYDYTVYVLVEDNQLEIGLDMNNAGADWAAIDNARLTYLISSLPASLTGASGKMNNTVVAAQTTAIAAYNAVDGQTPSNYAAAIEAIANAEASIAAYAKAATYLSSVEAVLATTNFYTPAAYASVYGTYKTAYDAGTLDDATADGLSYKVANYSGTERYDKNTANNLLIPGWTFGGNDASTSGSGFYINSWSTESDGSGDAADFANPFYEYWTDNNAVLSAKTISGTISGLTPNAPYSVTANVRVRQTDDQTKVAGSVTMQVGSGSTVDVTAGKQIGSTPRYIKSYTAVGNADSYGKLTLTFTVAGSSNISWLAFRDVNYTRLADDDDYTALNSAITAAEAHTLGFESGEYAPYNHAEVLQTLASAKTINSGENNSQLTVRTLTSTLNNASWTANAADVDAIYNNDFALATDGWNPDGWTSTGWAAKVDDINSSSSISETGKGWRPNTGTITYGSTGVYTMPLAANQLYKLTFKYGAWDGTPVPRISVLNGENGLAATELPGTSTNYKTAMNSWTMYFRTGVAGNYVLSMYASYNMVWTDVSLIKAEESEISLSESTDFTPATNTYYQTLKLGRTFPTDKVSTMVLPFAMNATATAAAFDKVYELSDVDGEIIKFTTADAITAGKPYIVKAKEDAVVFASNIKSSELVSDVTPVTEGTVTFTGTFSRIADLLDVTNSYIISNNNLYEVDSKVALKPFRGYFTITPSLVKAFVLDFGDATGINTIANSQQPMANGPIYNLAGQRLSKAQKGIYIINGKKVLVK